jgi:hypothetical protein
MLFPHVSSNLKKSIQKIWITLCYWVVFYDLKMKYQIVISYLQHLIHERDMIFDGETLQLTLCGTNLPHNAASSCHHSCRIDDGATAYVIVEFRIQHCHLKIKYALSLNRIALIICIFIIYSSDHCL